MNILTEYQENCLLVICNYFDENGATPTRQELTDMLGQKSTNGVNQILKALEKKRYIEFEPPRKRRNIIILKRIQRQFNLLNEVTA